MFGAILGDIVGSPYEFDCNNIKTKVFPLFTVYSHFTDDTVMTLAVAQALMETKDGDDGTLQSAFIREMRRLGRAYPDAGYGGNFGWWLECDDPKPYHSYGNGSAMRVSAAAWMFDTLEAVRRAARLSAAVTHDHPEGIKGAEATASAIFLARTGHGKEEIRDYIEAEFGYDLHRTCDEIRPTYCHVESCQESVPEAIIAFLEGESFEDVLRTAVSLGGDSDTIAAIAGSIAEGYYGVDEDWKKAAISRLPDDLAAILCRFDCLYGTQREGEVDPLHRAIRFAEQAHRGQKRKGSDVAYITHPMEVLQLLTEMGASRELLMAGVLHDTVEDTEVTIDEIRQQFGDRVASLVGSHTEDKSKTWRQRKQATLDELRTAERDVKLLILADKVSNLRSMLWDYRQLGEKLWERFNAPKELQSWYNSAMQDEMQELQYDEGARNVYWEMVGLYKDLFVTYYLSAAEPAIYQCACGGECWRLRLWEGAHCVAQGVWQRWEGELPADAVEIPRLKAERLEDLLQRS